MSWPSGLRRHVKAVVFIGVGSNPTDINFCFCFLWYRRFAFLRTAIIDYEQMLTVTTVRYSAEDDWFFVLTVTACSHHAMSHVLLTHLSPPLSRMHVIYCYYEHFHLYWHSIITNIRCYNDFSLIQNKQNTLDSIGLPCFPTLSTPKCLYLRNRLAILSFVIF